MPIKIDKSAVDAITQHGAADYPNECCGFLVGPKPSNEHSKAEATLITAAIRGRNIADSPENRFEIDPAEQNQVDKAARAEGLSLLGMYHSHPDSPASPSHYDREHAWAGYCYVIISVVNGCPQEFRNWILADERLDFVEDEVVLRS